MKKRKIKFIRKMAQNIADGIIERMGKVKTQPEFDRLYNMGIMLNSLCITKWEIYLD